ncbi:UDP-N-acetylmuramoyl-tripeptide--D-alanyl-D-alanine ligase [Croceivirga lutea]|uniref:UDP-N-acetylmuramoyl-tripeptide--D-alanyl-D- alanine ligase n=1 Tax=Croceivirga lutea TaxID=1775167 RepID=UPI001639D969|nr:UDP-N-acetylmuramoyl-tripeptide--D-alanyl-D-alanine ligase [Croceivirga lutea]GGG56186.1 UDP-N-acetylmuramoyl-tripeptide--D-alanyl-D-alanine ligase [Croceivirga lutea]
MNLSELHSIFLKHTSVSTDTRKVTYGCIFFALKGPNFNGNAFAKEAIEKGAAYAIIDEKAYALADKTILVDNVLETLQKLAIYHRNFYKTKVLSLTGSNGKTTTKELTNTVLKKSYTTIATKGNLNNHIGVPLTLLSITEETEIAIVEMGANHQGEIAFLSGLAQPDFGYITNFGKAHLEGFGGVEGVIKGKSELYNYLIENKKQIFFNADDPIQLQKLATYIKKYGYSQNNHEYYPIKFINANPFVTLSFEGLTVNTNLIGTYNFPNCASAILIGKYFNVPAEEIKHALENYYPNNNRSQLITVKEHQIILDAYNANPTSMKAALDNFNAIEADSKIAFLGDMFELGNDAELEHQHIADTLLSLALDKVYLVGENFANTTTNFKTFSSFDEFKKSVELSNLPKSSILIKGSRGMAMERILELL